MKPLQELIHQNAIVAILRGLRSAEARVIGELLYEAGVRVIEVPLNRPEAFSCIEILIKHLPKDCLIGAGTVLNDAQVMALNDIGVKLVVSPNFSSPVVACAIENNMIAMPGVATATEAFSAYQAGARWLKLFPAATYGVSHFSALKTVLPLDVNIVAVGGIGPSNIREWLDCGASAVGVGNDLYVAGDSALQVKEKLARFSRALTNY